MEEEHKSAPQFTIGIFVGSENVKEKWTVSGMEIEESRLARKRRNNV